MVTKIVFMPSDTGRLVMKLIAMCDEGLFNVGNSRSFPARKCLDILDCAHLAEENTKSLTYLHTEDHQYLFLISSLSLGKLSFSANLHERASAFLFSEPG